MSEHGATRGELEAECFAPTKVPSLKPSAWMAFLIAVAKYTARPPPGSVCFWLIVCEYRPLGDGRLGQEVHGPPTAGKQDGFWDSVCFILVVQSGIPAYGMA